MVTLDFVMPHQLVIRFGFGPTIWLCLMLDLKPSGILSPWEFDLPLQVKCIPCFFWTDVIELKS